MRTHSRYQYTQNRLCRGILVASLLWGASAPLLATVAPTAPAPGAASTAALDNWEEEFQDYLRRLWRLFEHVPPPDLGVPSTTLAMMFNDAYTAGGITHGLVDSDKHGYIATIFAAIDHLEAQPWRLDPVLYDATMNTLVNMLHDLRPEGQAR